MSFRNIALGLALLACLISVGCGWCLRRRCHPGAAYAPGAAPAPCCNGNTGVVPPPPTATPATTPPPGPTPAYSPNRQPVIPSRRPFSGYSGVIVPQY